MLHIALALKLTAGALVQTAAIAWIGATPWLVSRSLGLTAKFNAALAMGVGFLELLFVSWCFFKAQLALDAAFNFVVAANAMATAVASYLCSTRRISPRHQYLEIWLNLRPILPALVGCTAAYAVFVTSPLASDMLDMVVLGNKDIHMYVKMADFLAHSAGTVGNIVGIDLREVAQKDVFGAYVWLAFAAFLFHQDAVNVTLVPLVASVGMIGTSIAWISARIIRVPWLVGLGLAISVIYTALFSEVTLNYFLSQLIRSSLFLILMVTLTNKARESSGLTWSYAAICGFIFLAGISFAYNALFFHDLAAFALLGIWHVSIGKIGCSKSVVRELLRTIMIGLSVTAGIAGAVTLLAPGRMRYTFQLLLLSGNADIGGWPYGLMSPSMLTGLPGGWTYNSLAGWPIVQVAVLAAIAVIGAVIGSRGSESTYQKLLGLTPLILASGSLFIYLLVWSIVGPSYRQWKIAAFYPLLLGFAIPATFARGLCVYFSDNRQRVSMALTVLAFAIAIDNMTVASGWLHNVGRFSRDYLAIAKINDMPEVRHVLIDLPEFGARMLAASLIRSAQVEFVGPTYYGPGQSLPQAGSAWILRIRTEPNVAGIVLGDSFILSPPQTR